MHRAKHRADASQASKRSPIGASPRHERCNRYRKRVLFEVPIREWLSEVARTNDKNVRKLTASLAKFVSQQGVFGVALLAR